MWKERVRGVVSSRERYSSMKSDRPEYAGKVAREAYGALAQ